MNEAHPNRMEQAPGVAQSTPVPIPGAMLVSIDLVDRDPGQVRRDWRHDEGYRRLDELTQSVREFGILQPLVVRRDGDRYTVIAGGRRLVAARRAGLLQIPVVVRDEDSARLRTVQLIENLQRQQLSALDEARAYQEMMEIDGLTTGGVAARLHVSIQTVRDKLRLLRDQILADAVERRQITATVAREIGKLPDEIAEDLRRQVQAGQRFQVSDIHAIRARLRAVGVVNPRRNPRYADGDTEKQPSSELAAPTERPTGTSSRGQTATTASSPTATAEADERTDPMRAGDIAEAEHTGPLRELVTRLPWLELEELLEYGVAHGWTCAGLLHLAAAAHRAHRAREQHDDAGDADDADDAQPHGRGPGTGSRQEMLVAADDSPSRMTVDRMLNQA